MKRMILAAMLFFLTGLTQCGAQSPGTRAPMGVWVSVFTQHKVLFSHKAAAELITTCSQAGIDEIYLQLFQSGRAYYDSKLLARDKYDEMMRLAGGDMIDYILEEASKKNIKVFAWVNLLSLGQNEQAQIVRQHGRGVLTRDQYSRPSGKKNPNETDDYYLREDQIFLEPGDPRVGDFLGLMADEIAARYPGLSGVHLDYVRYPMTVPFSPGAKFSEYGINYGYGERNVERFKAQAGVDPLKGLR